MQESLARFRQTSMEQNIIKTNNHNQAKEQFSRALADAREKIAWCHDKKTYRLAMELAMATLKSYHVTEYNQVKNLALCTQIELYEGHKMELSGLTKAPLTKVDKAIKDLKKKRQLQQEESDRDIVLLRNTLEVANEAFFSHCTRCDMIFQLDVHAYRSFDKSFFVVRETHVRLARVRVPKLERKVELQQMAFKSRTKARHSCKAAMTCKKMCQVMENLL
jgi:hypothetical protein